MSAQETAPEADLHPESTGEQAKEEVPEGELPLSDEEKAAQKQGSGGLLSFALDPVGKVLQTGLKPVGAGLGAVTAPVTNVVGSVTEPLLDPLLSGPKSATDKIAEEGIKAKREREPIGGKRQTGDNPLGLAEP